MMQKVQLGNNNTMGGNAFKSWRRRWWLWLLVVSLLGGVVFSRLSKTRTTEGPVPGLRPVQASVAVKMAAAKKGDIGIYLTGLGTVTPISTVTVKSRVDGELVRVFYKEGEIVKKGQLLAEIDPRPFQAQLTQAQGQLIRDQAQIKNARVDLERYRVLTSQDSISEQQYATQKSLVNQLEGTVKFDQGQIDSAKLQLVIQPHHGAGERPDRSTSDRPGNIVHASDTAGLLVITQLEPITVIFTIPEDNLEPVLDKVRAGIHLPVDAYNREETQKLASGSLLTLDNQIDPNSGTLRLRANFSNKDHRLFPNQFVNARLLLETRHGVTLVPTAAIQRGAQGTFVFLIRPDNTVTVRQVKVGPTEKDETAIDEGLVPGDNVVVEGTERLREGGKVELKDTGNKAGSAPKSTK